MLYTENSITIVDRDSDLSNNMRFIFTGRSKADHKNVSAGDNVLTKRTQTGQEEDCYWVNRSLNSAFLK